MSAWVSEWVRDFFLHMGMKKIRAISSEVSFHQLSYSLCNTFLSKDLIKVQYVFRSASLSTDVGRP